MNNIKRLESEDYRALQILDELSMNGSLTQRELSKRLGIALGLVNSYIKNLIKKGYITVKAIPPRRYAYYLTPKGFVEKGRLAMRLLGDYTRVYREARSTLKALFRQLEEEGYRRVVFAGSDEVAEIAYITLQETGLELVGVVDDEKAGEKFFGVLIQNIKAIRDIHYDVVLIASYIKRRQIYDAIVRQGVEIEKIRSIFPQ